MSRLHKAATRAAKKGLSNKQQPAKPLLKCQQADKPQTYEDCVLKELVVQLDDAQTKSVAVTLDKQRRYEPVAATVYRDYKDDLTNVDLVMEAVTGVALPEVSHKVDLWDEAKAKVGAGPAPARPVTSSGQVKSIPHLKVRAQAFDSVSHNSFSPAHPRSEIGDKGVDGGGPADREINVPNRTGFIENWAAIWPFHADRTRTYDILGEACGITHLACNAPAAAALSNLKVRLVAYPSLEVKLTFEGERRAGKTLSKAVNMAKREGEKGSGVWGAKTVTTKIDDSTGSSSTSETTKGSSKYDQVSKSRTDKDDFTTTDTETRHGDDYSEKSTISEKHDKLIGSQTYSVSQSDSTAGTKKFEAKSKWALSDQILLTVSSAGQSASFKGSDISDFADKLMTIAAVVKDLGALLSSVQIGWSISYDYTLFQGSMSFAWGVRWPKAYAEENRVYYVERYVTASGDMKIVEGSVIGALGIKFDKGWLPAGVVAQITLNITAGVTLAPSISYAYTNPARKSAGHVTSECEAKFEISATLSAVGSARALGHSMTLKASIESKFTAKATLKLEPPEPPALPVSITFEGATLSGYFENTERWPHRKSFDPISLLDKREVMKERDLWK